jgi:hypothetical protein
MEPMAEPICVISTGAIYTVAATINATKRRVRTSAEIPRFTYHRFERIATSGSAIYARMKAIRNGKRIAALVTMNQIMKTIIPAMRIGRSFGSFRNG